MSSSTKDYVNFTDYDVLGFDMDYTLARYELVPFFKMSYHCVTKHLVELKKYDPAIFHDLEKERDLIYKGLLLDFETGHILKLGHDGVILRAVHGTKKLTQEEIIAAYGPERKFPHYETWQKFGTTKPNSKWRFFENYFDIPGLVAFAKILDHLRETGAMENRTTYEDVWADVYDSLFQMYNPSHFKENKGGFFPAMIKEADSYLDRASKQIKQWLQNLRQQNRKVFLMTSSNVDFAYFIMNHIFGKDWTTLFDLRLFQARKPSFFTDSRSFVQTNSNCEVGEPVKKLQADRDYLMGNKEDLMEFFRQETGKADPKVIYFGDNLWADAWPCSSIAGWDAVLVLEEMDAEGYAVSDGTVPGHEDEGEEDPDEPPKMKYRRYEHSSLVTEEELQWMVSDFWGSIFIDDLHIDRSGETKEEKLSKGLKMNTAYGDLISQYATICVPSIEYLAGVPVDHKFSKFAQDAGNARGFHPGRPKSLLVQQ
ncbi:5-nucleotidase domain-containing protein 1 [Plakobranchus ocellatus]|uniref:5-nucleotidase domain-containing protein 1 n=1 Tax=Plakobranchus ocellatus TaxID=259542 RepID=A0AAV4BAE8_9GAST|nr:5-nucleotidase domain-containing protein 1 [Plakobranchus ocellatus]